VAPAASFPVMQSTQRRRIFLVDDHPVVLSGLTSLLNAQHDLEVAGTARTAADALGRIGAANAELAIVDIGIGDVAGLDLVQDFRLRFPRLRVLCFSVHEEEFFAERALRAGAQGYVMKTVDSTVLLRAVRTVLDGQIHLSDTMERRILNRLGGTTGVNGVSPIRQLSNREIQVIHHIAASRDNRQIARLMSLSVKTVEAHRSRIKEKLSLRTTSELIRFATHWVERQASFSEQAPGDHSSFGF
jgi:DNA-binding NarL/FixJ family response regulator